MPDQVPGAAERTCPACAVPLIVGNELFAGATGAAATTAVCAELALLEPTEFDPATATRNVEPTSAATAVYAWAAAPEISLQLPPDVSHRRH